MQTFTPIEYLKIDIASNFGLDKESWNERLLWVDTREDYLESLIDEAEEPALFFAGVRAYREAQKGNPIGYPISLDATSSGAQLLAILIGCEKSARLCNVIDTGRREDFYTNIYSVMHKGMGEDSKIGRKDVKRAIMTSLYSSVAVPKEVFGEGDLLEMFHQVMNEEAPGVWKLNEALLGLWQADALSHDWVLPDNFHVHVKVMDDITETVHFLNRPYEVRTKVNQSMEEGRSIGANLVHSIDGMIVREILRRCTYDADHRVRAMELIIGSNFHTAAPSVEVTANTTVVQALLDHFRSSGFLSARIIEHLDTTSIKLLDESDRDAVWELLESMPERPFPVLSIHDCFRVHPNYGNDLRRQYNRILHDLAQSTLLSNLASQIAGCDIQVSKFQDFSVKVLEANYALS